MVDAVVRRRVHHRLEPSGQPLDRLGMDPELIDQVQPRAEEDHRRRKADQEQGQAEQEGQAEKTRPRLPERGRQIIMRSEEHTSELQSLMRISSADFCLKIKKNEQLNTVS